MKPTSLRHLSARILCLLLLVLLIASSASSARAELIVFSLHGRIAPGPNTDFRESERFSGIYTFESDTSASAGPDAFSVPVRYINQTSWSFVFERGFRFNGSQVSISVGNNRGLGDRYLAIFGQGSSTGTPLPSGATFRFAAIDLIDFNEPRDLLMDESIQVNAPILSRVSNPSGRFAFMGMEDAPFVIDRLELIPEPSTALLFACGLLAMSAGRARRSRVLA